jgi:hypothetical protein
MAGKPSVVLVHGLWGGAAHWAKVITELHNRGFGSQHAVENPPDLITEAGDLPNVTGLVYVAAFAPDAGESSGERAPDPASPA